MLQKTYHVHNNLELFKMLQEAGRSPEIRNAACLLIFAFLEDADRSSVENKLDMLSDSFPEAVISGMTDKRVIYHNPEHLEDSYTFLVFETGEARVFSYPCIRGEEKTASAALLQDLKAEKELQGVLVFGASETLSLERFVYPVAREFPMLPFFGGRSGLVVYPDGRSLMAAFHGKDPMTEAFVCVTFSGKDLHLRVHYNLGWIPIGKKMTITKAEDFVIHEIDNAPTSEVYTKYFGLLKEQLTMDNVCAFPFIMNKGGLPVARIMIQDAGEGAFRFSANVEEGEQVQLSYADPGVINKETYENCQEIHAFGTQALLMNSCLNRTLFLGEEEKSQFKVYRRAVPEFLSFHGYSELYILGESGGELTSALVSIAFREGELPESLKQDLSAFSYYPYAGESVPLVNRLVTFLSRTTAELERSANEAREANEAKTRFISHLSHEIRTPINAILGLDEMILRESGETKIREYASDIRNSGRTLLSLINDVLDLSRIESGRIKLVPEEYEVGSALNDLMNMVLYRAREKDLDFIVHVDPTLPHILYGDETRIKECVMNLLTNAIKYTKEGSITLEIEYEKTGEDEILVTCRVKDTGIGIRKENIPIIISPYVRIEEGKNRDIEGTGLGLSIVTELLAEMGSRIEIESEYGKGSTFFFRLAQKVVDWTPIGDMEAMFRETKKVEGGYSAGFRAPEAKILVVDDILINIKVLQGLLKQTKIKLDIALSGFECLEKAAAQKYDLIFLDQRMPEMDGMETLKHLKEPAFHMNEKTPVIMLTADAVFGAREAFLKAGFDDYLSKPVDPKRLERLLIQYLPADKVEYEDRAGASETKAPDEMQQAEAEAEEACGLEGIPGLNTETGLENCFGDEETYQAILEEYANTAQGYADELEGYLRENNIERYTILVHSLKSASRAIGAMELGERAAELQELGDKRETEDIIKKTPDFIKSFREMGAAIGGALGTV